MRRILIILTVILFITASQSLLSHNRASQVDRTAQTDKSTRTYIETDLDSVVIDFFVPFWNLYSISFRLQTNGDIVLNYYDDLSNRRIITDVETTLNDSIFKYVNRLFIENPELVYSSVEPSSICDIRETPQVIVRLYKRTNYKCQIYYIVNEEYGRIVHFSDEFKNLYKILFDIGLDFNKKYGDDDDELFPTYYDYYPEAVAIEPIPEERQRFYRDSVCPHFERLYKKYVGN